MNLFDTEKAAEYLKGQGVPFTANTLTVWRCLKRGPRYKRISRRVFYDKADLDNFLTGQSVDPRH